MTEISKPKKSAQSEIDKAAAQFDKFSESVAEMTMDRANLAPKAEAEPLHRMSAAEQQASRDVYLKPKRTIGSREKFDEKFRKEYEVAKEFVHFIAENREIIGENIELWTKPFPGVSAEEWSIPPNKPVWGPRYLAEQIKRKYYHRLVMQEVTTETSGMGKMYGQLAADTTVQRLDAHPVNQRKSVFMGSNSFN